MSVVKIWLRVVLVLCAGAASHAALAAEYPAPTEADFVVRNFRFGTGERLPELKLPQLSLPRDEFPNLVDSAEDTAEVWLSDPDRWWRNTVDLITFGLERMLERSRNGSGPQANTS